jgi:carbonic anhydrase
MSWLEEVAEANRAFVAGVDRLPQRGPGHRAVITCMDSRINLAAIGMPGFDDDPQVRIIRTLGAQVEPYALLVGIFLAGFREILVLGHTDCGCAMAHHSIATIQERMAEELEPDRLATFIDSVGSGEADLQAWLRTFEDPRAGVTREVAYIASLPFVPSQVIVHGMIYDVDTGSVELVVDGTR